MDNRFDGDQINFTLSLDNRITEHLKNLSPHKSVFDLNEPRKVSGNLAMPKPVVSTHSNWMSLGATHDPVKYEKMVALFGNDSDDDLMSYPVTSIVGTKLHKCVASF